MMSKLSTLSAKGFFELIKDVSFRQDRIRLQLLAAIQTLDQLREDFEYHVDEPGHSTGSSLRQQIQELQTGLWSYRDVGGVSDLVLTLCDTDAPKPILRDLNIP